ncbi:MAG TPA: XRE family transcriptional regulator [Candidatus Avipropionibacterium sp.]|nr:XRE family transcriptional regulator [Candidatus Avipropionibacterium sp.]
MNELEISRFVGSKISYYRKKKRITQEELGKMLGVKNNTISAYERGTISTDQNILFQLADIFDISINDFFPSSEDRTESTKYNYFPTAISAGQPLTIDGITEASKISVSDEILGKYRNDRSIFFARASGDSMDRIINDGSLIAIKPVDNVESLKNGDIVVFSTNHEYSVKHIYKTDTSIIFKPNSTNLDHHEQHLSYKDEITIYGKVVASVSIYD